MGLIRASQEITALGDYDILGRVAAGSMATVYKGRHRTTGTLAALKVPTESVLSQKVLRERFFQEYRAGLGLKHPNIVRTLDFGQDGPLYYLVLEFIEGQDLWEHVQQHKRLPEQEAVGIIVQIAQALNALHRQGIIHRDVKPDNILITADGTAKLGDLGLIKELESNLELTCPDKGLGSPHFIGPEQFTDARAADMRCDVYSLGATLYTAVTGVLPFDAPTLGSILRKKQTDELVPPRDFVPELSRTVDFAIRRALQSHPVRRQANCLEFIATLMDEMPAARPAAPPGGKGSRVKRPARERRGFVRYPCSLATICELVPSIHNEAGEPDNWATTIVNLSVAGIGLLLDRRFEIGTEVAILLQNPDRSVQVRKDVQVVRTISAGTRQWYVGATFTTPLEKTILRKLL